MGKFHHINSDDESIVIYATRHDFKVKQLKTIK